MRSCFTVAGLPRTKRLALAILISMLATESLAISRYEVGNKSCGELHAIVRRDGAAILRWRSQRTGIPLYERFVRNWNYCPAGQTTDSSSVPAADGRCPLLKCVQIEDLYNW